MFQREVEKNVILAHKWFILDLLGKQTKLKVLLVPDV